MAESRLRDGDPACNHALANDDHDMPHGVAYKIVIVFTGVEVEIESQKDAGNKCEALCCGHLEDRYQPQGGKERKDRRRPVEPGETCRV